MVVIGALTLLAWVSRRASSLYEPVPFVIPKDSVVEENQVVTG